MRFGLDKLWARLTRMTSRRGKRAARPSWFARHPRFTRTVLLAGTFFFCAGIGGALAAWTLVCSGNRCPSVQVLESFQPSQTSKLYAVDGRFVTELGAERRTLVRFEDIPQHVRDAFVITEDKRFYRHNGIDWLRIPGSALRNIQAGGFAEGFSTITMQLARNIFPEHISRERTLSRWRESLIRKIKEGKVAVAIENAYPKERILELYLNQINLGSGAYGIETASQRYFGKSVRDLNLAEAATLAAIPKAPTRYNPRRYAERAVMRRNTILELMRRNGAITNDQASLAKAFPLQLARGVESGDVAPYFVEWIRQELEKKFGERLYDEGLRVYTTLDLDLQTAADRALETQLRTIESGKYGRYTHTTFEQFVARGGSAASATDSPESPYLQAAFVAVDPRNGAVRALIGGRDFDDSKFNRATQALRQPGSTFKPFVYATALTHGRTAATVYDDSPISLPQVDGSTWTPQNYDLKFEGPMTMRHGLAQSRNIVAIRAGMDVGERAVIETARRFGIQSDIPPYPSIFIGSADVYPIQLIGAYSVFANLGTRVEPYGIIRVENQRGEVIWAPTHRRLQVLGAGESWLMVSMMKDVVQRGTAAGSVWGAGFHTPSGGKTGTTNDGADVWYVGYTADLVAGVWMGFDKPRKIMANAQGGRLAAPAWTQFMMEVYRRKPVPPDWPRPASVVTAVACGANGFYTEYFLAGTESHGGCGQLNPFSIIPQRDTLMGEGVIRQAAGSTSTKPATKAKADTANPFRIP